MGIQLSGIFSGIDTDSIVSQLIAVNRRPMSILESRQAVQLNRKDAIEDIEARMESLRSATASLRETGSNTLRAVTTTSSDTSIVTVSATQSAGEGSHSLVVNRLASSQKEIHDGVAELTTLVGEGQFVYTYGTGDEAVTRTIQTTDEITIATLRDLINNDSANPGVMASILEYDAGGGGVYHLVMTGRNSGSDYDIAMDAATTLDGTLGTVDFTDAAFTVSQVAQDSQVRVDGYPSAAWIERSSNSLTDVIPGLTLSLQDAGAVNISATRNTSQLTLDMQNLVAIYNGIAEKVAQYTGYNSDSGLSGILQGDSTTSMALARLRNLFIGAPTGFESGSDAFYLPADIGLELGKASDDGTSTLNSADLRLITFDSSTFSDAISEDYFGVLSFIGAIGTGVSDSDEIQFTSATDNTAAGQYEIEVDYTDGSISVARIRAAGDTAWQFLSVSGNTLTGETDTDFEGLELTTASFSGTGTSTANIRVRKGMAGTIYDAVDDMLNTTSGLLQVKLDHIETVVESLDKEIDRLETRLETQEKALRAKYARLEAALSQIQSQNGAFEALFSSLSSNSDE